MNKKILGITTTCHVVNDLHQGAIPALLPFLIDEHNLTYAAAAVIVFAFTGTATVIQPVIGLVVDRFSKSWFIPVGIMLTGIGFAMTGVISNYFLLISVVIISGIGSAVFHPEAAKIVNYAGGGQKATAMSIFGVGGVLGFSIGPFIITTAVMIFGLKGSLITMIPVIGASILFFLTSSSFNSLKLNVVEQEEKLNRNAKNRWLAFTLLSLTIVGKSVIYYGLFTFIPLYWTSVLKQSQIAGGTALTLFSIAGVVGNLAGGRLADKIGYRKVIVVGCFFLIPALSILLKTENVLIATLMVIVVGALLVLSYAPTVILGQKYLANNIGLSSGMTLGVTFSVGGMVTPFLGYQADQYGLSYALGTMAIIPVIITLISFTLPPSRRGVMC